MRLKSLDLIVTIIISVLNVVWALLPYHSPVVGVVLALPLVFVLPGYTLTEALILKRSLDAPQLLVFSLGLSLAIDVLSGLVLNVLPVGLQAISWAMLLGLLTTVLSLFAAYLRFQRKDPVKGIQPARFHFNIFGGILFGLAMIVVGLSVLYAACGAAQQPYPGFTQFVALPEVQAGKSCDIRLGVRSFETVPLTYNLTITANGEQLSASPLFTLAPQKEWDRLVQISPVATAEIYVEARLYRVDKPGAVYREVHLTFNNLGGSIGAGTRLCGAPTVNASSASLTGTYSGTFYNIPADLKSSMFLTGIRQSGRNFTGYFSTSAGELQSTSFKGTIVSAQDIQFTVTQISGAALLFFEGELQPGGTLSGSYCELDQAGQCSNKSNTGYGLWSVMPVS